MGRPQAVASIVIAGDPGRVVIVGAGPTGLGAAFRLAELGYEDFVVLDLAAGPGGLASSVVDAQGFTWDIGGHVQFSHYAYYDRAVDRAVAGQWLTHERESWVWIRGRFVPYPFQNNLHRLDPDDRDRAVAGLEHARELAQGHGARPAHFGDWIDRTFGPGLASLFMRPYNLKVWGYPLEAMDTGWMGERVAVPDVDRIKHQILAGQDDVSWGPNRTFRFPVRGGTGAMWTGIANLLPRERLRFSERVTSIDDRVVVTAGGDRRPFDTLVSTMPLDRCCEMTSSLDVDTRQAAASLRHSSVHVIGVGLEGTRPSSLARKCWMYFPEAHSPYYRVTVFSNYSPHHVPADGDHWSLMAEVCESPHKPVSAHRLVDDVVAAFRCDGLIAPTTRIVSRWHHREEYGYPTPFLGRDAVLAAIRPALEARRVFSRGRFGAWKYEVSNQDHAFMQGVELVDRLLFGDPEITVDHPDVANSGRFLHEDRTRQPGSASAYRGSADLT
jgi:protoporphyrinogen oxidase